MVRFNRAANHLTKEEWPECQCGKDSVFWVISDSKIVT